MICTCSTKIIVAFRYDYENCKSEPCNKMMSELEAKVTSAEFVGKVLVAGNKSYVVKASDNYRYTDPIDKSVATKQVGNNFQLLCFI